MGSQQPGQPVCARWGEVEADDGKFGSVDKLNFIRQAITAFTTTRHNLNPGSSSPNYCPLLRPALAPRQRHLQHTNPTSDQARAQAVIPVLLGLVVRSAARGIGVHLAPASFLSLGPGQVRVRGQLLQHHSAPAEGLPLQLVPAWQAGSVVGGEPARLAPVASIDDRLGFVGRTGLGCRWGEAKLGWDRGD